METIEFAVCNYFSCWHFHYASSLARRSRCCHHFFFVSHLFCSGFSVQLVGIGISFIKHFILDSVLLLRLAVICFLYSVHIFTFHNSTHFRFAIREMYSRANDLRDKTLRNWNVSVAGKMKKYSCLLWLSSRVMTHHPSFREEKRKEKRHIYFP